VNISAFREDGSEFVLEVMGPVCGEGAAFDGTLKRLRDDGIIEIKGRQFKIPILISCCSRRMFADKFVPRPALYCA